MDTGDALAPDLSGSAADYAAESVLTRMGRGARAAIIG